VNDQPLQDAQLRDLAQQLGVRAAERLDPEQTAQAVLRRLREPRQTPNTRWRPLWLSAAATVALLISGGLVWRSVRPAAPSSATAGQGLDLNDLSAEQLRDVLNAVEQPLDVDATGFLETGIDDLSPGELRTLLRALEG